MAGDIGLVGGEEFRVGCEEMDREIMRASGQDPARVVIIPTAAVTGPEKAANDGVRHFSSLGGAAESLMVLERDHADDAGLAGSLSGAGVIYFTGGSPDHLLTTLRDSLLWRAILEAVDQGAVLPGSSAGAMVLGELMRRPHGIGGIDAPAPLGRLGRRPGRDAGVGGAASPREKRCGANLKPAAIPDFGPSHRVGHRCPHRLSGPSRKLASSGLGKGDRIPDRRLAGL